jgi:hypothetical protein
MAFDWGTAASVGGSLLGGFMGGSKEGEREAKDQAARAAFEQRNAVATAKAATQPFVDSGVNANKLLNRYLGIDYSGYGKRPELQDYVDKMRDAHFKHFGRDYTRKSNTAGQQISAKQLYEQALKEYEAGLENYKQSGGDFGDGRLLREFSNEDFVKDPGYNFRMDEGNKGIDRAFASRGGTNSGAALKAIARFNQDYASNEFGNAFNRDSVNKSNIYNFLSGQSAQGLGAATQQGNMSIGAATNIGNINQNAANQVLQQQNIRNENQGNALQSAIGNYIYGTERAKDRAVLGKGATVYGGQTGAYPNAYYA